MNVAPGIAFAIPGLRIFKEKERTFLELKNMLELKKGRRNMQIVNLKDVTIDENYICSMDYIKLFEELKDDSNYDTARPIFRV